VCVRESDRESERVSEREREGESVSERERGRVNCAWKGRPCADQDFKVWARMVWVWESGERK
jgi:hypothetical protein